MLKNVRIRWITASGTLVSLVFASPAAAATNVGCRNQWAGAFKPVVDNITGNAKGLFVVFAIPAVIIALVALALLHGTRHRGTFVAVFGFILLAAIGIAVAPTIVDTFTTGVCP